MIQMHLRLMHFSSTHSLKTFQFCTNSSNNHERLVYHRPCFLTQKMFIRNESASPLTFDFSYTDSIHDPERFL